MAAQVVRVTEMIAIYVADEDSLDDLPEGEAVSVASENMVQLGKGDWTHTDTARIGYNVVMVTFEP